MGLIDSASSATTNLVSTATKSVQNISSVASGGISSITSSADSVVKMAQNGISNAASAAYDSVAGKVKDAIGSVQNQFKNMTDLGNIFKSAAPTPALNLSTAPPYPNILHNYASYNYIFTLSAIDKDSLNDPLKYRKGSLGEIILRSGSGYPNERTNTAFGKFDFIIDDVRIKSIVKPNQKTGNSFSTNITFKVIEPYSMGIFFTALETASTRAGYKNWIDAPYLLTVEFIGHINGDIQGVNADTMGLGNSTRYFPIRLISSDMSSTLKGSVYDIVAVPYNEIAFSNTYSKLKTDISIAGKTVQEMLQTGPKSLQKVINDRLKIAAKRQGIKADEIVIYFPEDTGTSTQSTTESAATTSSSNMSVAQKLKLSRVKDELVQESASVNPIGKASMEFDSMRPGDPSFPKEAQVYDTQKKIFSREKVTLDPNLGEMRFAQDANIVNIINEVVLSSGYSRQALKENQLKNGQIPWWKVEPQVYLISESDNIKTTGVSTKLIVYRIIPYGVDASAILSPNAPNSAIGEVRKMAAKEYNYIYTGKNTDVLNFNINFKLGFYKDNLADLGQNSDSADRDAQTKNSAGGKTEVPDKPAEGALPGKDNLPSSLIADKTQPSTANKGGTSRDTPAVNAARRAHDMFLNSVDMLNLDMTIAGDPYFLADSGVGNYIAGKSNYPNINSDYAIDTQSGDNTIIVNFKTPIDIDANKGTYNFGPTELVTRFSGVYNLIECESSFSKGKFTQLLKGTRQAGQTGFNGQVISTGELPKFMYPTKSVDVPLNQSVEDVVASQNASVTYGTTEGSQQNEMLAKQDKEFD